MRCNNCGYDNDPGVSTCIKCGHQLQMGGAYAPSPYQGVYVPNNGNGEQLPKATVIGSYGGSAPLPKATVIGVAGMQGDIPHPTRVMASPAQQPQATDMPQDTTPCPACGYPVMKDFAHCPSCGTSMKGARQPSMSGTDKSLLNAKDLVINCDSCGEEVPANFAFCPYCGEKIQAKTVFRRKHNIEPPKPKCSLTLIPEDDEQVDARTNRYEGSTVKLTRENTEPGNRSITTKEQAELLCEDGKWFVVNRSELCSTAVEASRKIELQAGDVVVLGDRRFKFDVEA